MLALERPCDQSAGEGGRVHQRSERRLRLARHPLERAKSIASHGDVSACVLPNAVS